MRQKSFKRGFVYMVRNKRTGRFYVGQQSKWPSKGLKSDEIMGKLYFTSNKRLAKEWKTNPDDFEWSVLVDDITDKRDLDFIEAQFIFEMWKKHIPCYNRLINITLAKRKCDGAQPKCLNNE